jgi:parvulin-like peptidyl-prolyl isomerase
VRISRLLSVPLCVAALAYGLSACGATSPYAVRVNGDTTSQSSVTKELKVLADSKEFGKLVEQGGQTKLKQANGTLNSAITAKWLAFVIEDQAISQALAKKNVKVTAADRKNAKSQAEELFGASSAQAQSGQPASKGAFSSFPKWFQDLEIERFARQNAYARTSTKKVSDAELKKSYDAQISQVVAACPSKKFVAHILVKTQAEADAVEQQLKAGTDFNKLAAQKSIDPGSKDAGGEYGCLDSVRAQIDPTFVAAVDKAAYDVPTDPVQTSAGFHVIKITNTFPFEAAKSPIRKSLQQPSDAISALLKKATVKLNPRYGTWVTSGQTAPHVEPPKGSTPTTKPAVSGTAPSSTNTTPATQPSTSTP